MTMTDVTRPCLALRRHDHHVCSSCGTIWDYYRKSCAACREELGYEMDETGE
jgi:predicted amidophosphoribosyltransferase